MANERFAPKNRILTALPDGDLLRLQPYLETVPLVPGSLLLDAYEPLTHVYFVEAGVASLLATGAERAVGAAAVGCEGAFDIASLLLGGNTACGGVRVLVPGSALAVEVPMFRNVLRDSPTLQTACERFVKALFVQMLQVAACSRLHTVEQRCVSWLLEYADRAEDDELELAEEGFAQTLGVSRSTLIVAIAKLESDSLVRCRRGAITLLDRDRLEIAACACYPVARGQPPMTRGFARWRRSADQS
jgi:CRP-like cAMP-binding protein